MKRHVAAAVIVAALATCGVVATFAVSFATGSGRRADAKVFEHVGRRDAPQLREVARRIGGDTLNAAAAAGVIVAGSVLALLSLAGKTRLSGWAIAVLVGGAFVTTEVLKSALADRAHDLAPSHRPAMFPSGHATVAMAVVLAAVLSAPRRRALVALVATFVVSALGVLIVVGHLHPPSDVVGGFLVSATWAALMAPFVRTGNADAPSERRSAVLMPVSALGFFGLVFLLAAADVVGSGRFLVALVGALGAVATVIVVAIRLLVDGPRWERGGQDPRSAYVEREGRGS